MADTSVAELDHMIRHMPDGLVMRDHNDGVPVFLIHILDQLQDFFRRLIVQRTRWLVTK